MSASSSLENLGLSAFFTAQLSPEEIEQERLVRVIEIQRTHMVTSDGTSEWRITLGGGWYQLTPEHRPTIGDWVLLNESRDQIIRLLDRKSVFKRVAAGEKAAIQLIAANVDTLFIVTSCNDEFNESRLERYLAMALEAGVDPVVILTKADLTDAGETYRQRVMTVDASIPVDIINAKDRHTFDRMKQWISSGSTVALVGSSGVGKSTILNSLSESIRSETGAIREQDAKGRHTTSYRSLHTLPGGGLLMDVPGIRELKVVQLEDTLDATFDDVEEFARQCKYSNCAHAREPGCAVNDAIQNGTLDRRRLENYNKLAREDLRNTASLSQQRNRGRQLSKAIKQHVSLKKKSDNPPRS